MKTKNLKLELKLWGSVLDSQVSLEGNVIGLWVCKDDQTCAKELPDYHIDGNSLDVEIIAKGKNGASATLTIKIEGQKDEVILCEIKNGFTKIEKSIPIK